MSKIDYNLVLLHSENSRMGLNDLSKYLHKSPQRLKYAIAALIKEGVFKTPYCVFDHSYFGLLLFRVYFRGAYVNEQEKEKIVAELSKLSSVVAIYELTGEFDLVVEFASPNPSRFNKELKNLSESISTLNDFKIILNLVTYICPKHYLTKNKEIRALNRERILGGDRERESFSANEIKVMKYLVDEPLIRITQLAKKSKLNIKTVNSVFKSLLKRNIIRGFGQIIDYNQLGINKSRLFLRLHNISKEREAQLREYILAIDEVVQFSKTVGDWDIELDIESLERGKIRYFILQIREQFKDIVEKFNVIEFYGYHCKTFLPKNIFEEPALKKTNL